MSREPYMNMYNCGPLHHVAIHLGDEILTSKVLNMFKRCNHDGFTSSSSARDMTIKCVHCR